MSRGWVYVLDNPSMPGKVKIGFTERIPDMRANELDATGVPTPFVLQFTALVDRAFDLERAVHAAMDANRVRQNREWFDLTVDEAIDAVRSTAEEIGLSLLFEDDRFPDERKIEDDGEDDNDVAVDFGDCLLKNDLGRALIILKSILANSPIDTEGLISRLYDDSLLFDEFGEMERNEVGQNAADILAGNEPLETLIFNLLFYQFLPKTADKYSAIKLFWRLFPKRRKLIDQFIDAHVNRILSCDLSTDEIVWELGYFSLMLVERNRVDKAIEILQFTAPVISKMKYSRFGPKRGVVLPIGAILNTSRATKQLDEIIKQLLQVPMFVNCLVKYGFPEKYKYTEVIEKFDLNNIKTDVDGFVITHDIFKGYVQTEQLLIPTELEPVKDFLAALANKEAWRCMQVSKDGNSLFDDVYEQVAEEMSANNIKQGLWTRAYALASGDEKITKAQYIKLRVEQLTRDNAGR